MVEGSAAAGESESCGRGAGLACSLAASLSMTWRSRGSGLRQPASQVCVRARRACGVARVQLAGVDAAETKGLDLYAMCCVVGYCLAPIAVFSALSLMLPRCARPHCGRTCTARAPAPGGQRLGALVRRSCRVVGRRGRRTRAVDGVRALPAAACRGLASAGLGVLCTLWAALTAAKILVRRCPALEDSRAIITFPCTLLYAAFTMLALY